MSCDRVDDAAAWVLGALPADDEERFAVHLEDCAICRREVAELRMVADTLPLAAAQVAPPPELKERLMAAVRAEAEVLEATGPQADRVAPQVRPETAGAAGTGAVAAGGTAAGAEPGGASPARDRKKPRAGREGAWWRRPLLNLRPIPAALGAAVLIALGVGVGVLASGGSPAERTVQAQVVSLATPGARASLTVSDDRATLNVSDFPAPPSGRVYQVWLKRPGRPPAPTDALFDVRDGRATVSVPGNLKGVEQVLVTDEPAGGSPAPTRNPVVVAQPA